MGPFVLIGWLALFLAGWVPSENRGHQRVPGIAVGGGSFHIFLEFSPSILGKMKSFFFEPIFQMGWLLSLPLSLSLSLSLSLWLLLLLLLLLLEQWSLLSHVRGSSKQRIYGICFGISVCCSYEILRVQRPFSPVGMNVSSTVPGQTILLPWLAWFTVGNDLNFLDEAKPMQIFRR